MMESTHTRARLGATGLAVVAPMESTYMRAGSRARYGVAGLAVVAPPESTHTRARTRFLLGVAGLAVVAGCGSGSGAAMSSATGLTGVTTAATDTSAGASGASTTLADDALRFDVGGAGPEGESEGDSGECIHLECQIPTCPEGQETTIRGTVFAPDGALPIYNAAVYVPNAPLGPPSGGVTCESCAAELTGEPLVVTYSDTSGEFTLTGVPAGDDIPLAIVLGKWRRTITLPHVEACADNLADPADTRLPRNHHEGDIPRTAVTTGGADSLECLLRRFGVDDEEFTVAGGPGRVHLYVGRNGARRFADELGGADFTAAEELWGDPMRLAAYDMLIFSCEGSTDEASKPAEARQNLVDYADAGGRVFLSHWHNVWVELGADPWPSAAVFDHKGTLKSPTLATINTSFPRGQALAEWLAHVDGGDPFGAVSIFEGKHTITDVNPALATPWIYTAEPQGTQCFSFKTPLDLPDDERCGRVVDTDIHVTLGNKSKIFPTRCPGPDQALTAQEKVLLFMFLQLASCLIPGDESPLPG